MAAIEGIITPLQRQLLALILDHMDDLSRRNKPREAAIFNGSAGFTHALTHSLMLA